MGGVSIQNLESLAESALMLAGGPELPLVVKRLTPTAACHSPFHAEMQERSAQLRSTSTPVLKPTFSSTSAAPRPWVDSNATGDLI
jgi:hypothetical protein